MADTHEKQEHAPVVAGDPDVEEDMSVGRYILTRLPTLVPPMNPAPNPFKALTLLNLQQWLFFLVRPSILFSLTYTNEHRSRFSVGHGMLLISLPSP